jgi:hypothetical protein
MDRAITAMWKRGLTVRPPLDPAFLWAKGSEGFSPEDEVSIRSAEDVADFRARLDMLCRSLRDEARLNALGHTMAYGQIVAAIEKRHALGRLWRERPELAATDIAPPIAVVGQMRAGTTRVHRLLAADPRHAGTRFCNAVDPVPPRRGGTDWRPLKTRAGLTIARLINPWLDSQHPFGATRADEELGWLTTALDVCAFEAQWHIPSYVRFSEQRDAAPLYREFARILRTDAAMMGNAARPRVLKCPKFAEDLPSLLAQLPGTRLVATRREPDDVLASSVSLVAAQSAFQSATPSLETIRREWQRKLALREGRIEEALSEYSGPLAKVDFAALGRDWQAEIAQIYAALGLTLTDEALQAMGAEQARAATGAHHAHRSQIAGFSAS